MGEVERAFPRLQKETGTAPPWPLAQFSDTLELYPMGSCEKYVSDLALSTGGLCSDS